MMPDLEGGVASKDLTQYKPDILQVIGDDGTWQRRIFLASFLSSFFLSFHTMAMTFLAPEMDHWCAKTPDASHLSPQQWRSVGLPPEDQKCSRYESVDFSSPITSQANTTNSSLRRVVACDSWEYDNSLYMSSVLSKWDLVCDREWLVSMSKSVFVIGQCLAVTVFGYLADRMGRRIAIALSAFTGVCAAIACTLSTSFPMFIISRFFTALGMGGCDNTVFVLLMEVVGPERRSVYGLGVMFGWCIGYVCLPGIAWLLRDWFWIQAAITLPALLMFFAWWFVPESPRWLMSQGRVDEAKVIIFQAAELNGISNYDLSLNQVLLKASEVHESGESGGNLLNLLRIPGLRNIALNIYFAWLVNAFVYYGLSFNTNELAGDPFVNFALSGAVEFPAYLLSIFAIRTLGRRNTVAGTMVIAGLACLLAYPLPKEPWWASVVVSMLGKFCISASFAIVFVFTAELFPTVVRNIGLGSASSFSRLGSVLAPFVRELGHATHPVMPHLVFGVLSAVSGSLVLLLPETGNCAVADTLKEATEASKKQPKKSNIQNGSPVSIPFYPMNMILEDNGCS